VLGQTQQVYPLIQMLGPHPVVYCKGVTAVLQADRELNPDRKAKVEPY